MRGAITLVLGGARSGKSGYAAGLAVRSGQQPVFVATAEDRGDDEMSARIARHRKERDSGWATIEEPIDLAGVVRREAAPDRFLLVDCLTLWLSNLYAAGCDANQAVGELCTALSEAAGPVVLVSNEVGLGIVPANDLAREFRDEAGRMNQRVAEHADTVVIMAAGLPMPLKRDGQPVFGE